MSLLLLRLLLTGVCIDAYKPVIIVHGIFDGPKQFKTLSMYIDKVGRVNITRKSLEYNRLLQEKYKNIRLYMYLKWQK